MLLDYRGICQRILPRTRLDARVGSGSYYMLGSGTMAACDVKDDFPKSSPGTSAAARCIAVQPSATLDEVDFWRCRTASGLRML